MADEKRLIDAKALYESALDLYRKGDLCDECASEILNLIDDAHTVDAVEVVHGRWVYHDPVSPNCFCSVCHRDAPWDFFGDYHSERTNFCPNCGARMDGADHVQP